MTENKYNFGQSSSRPDKSKYFKWAIWVEESPAVLDEIKSVTYYLHKSFPNPIQRKVNKDSNFKLETAGWGTFLIRMVVEMKDGTTLNQTHYLVLDNDYNSTVRDRSVPLVDEQEAADDPKTVFISYSSLDSDIANKVQKLLKGEGLNVVVANDAPSGSQSDEFIEESIDRASAVISIESDYESPWLDDELKMAEKKQKSVHRVKSEDKSLLSNLKDQKDLLDNDLIQSMIKQFKV